VRLARPALSGTTAPVRLLLLQGAGALALLAAMALLTRTSLLAKVVAAILAGVLVMAVAAVGVVGTVVVTQYDRENRGLVRQAAQDRVLGLQDVAQQASLVAGVAPAGCKDPRTCAAVLRLFGQRGADFLVRVPQSGEPSRWPGARRCPGASCWACVTPGWSGTSWQGGARTPCARSRASPG